MQNAIDISYSPGMNKRSTKKIYQHDYGVKLRVLNIAQDAEVQVQYAIRGMKDTLMDIPVLEDGAYVSKVPGALLTQPNDIYAYVYISTEDAGKTVMEVAIPIEPRPKPSDVQYTPEQIQGYTQLLKELGVAVDEVETLKQETSEAISKTETAVTNANTAVEKIVSDAEESISKIETDADAAIDKITADADSAIDQITSEATGAINKTVDNAVAATNAANLAATNANNAIAGLDDKISEGVEERIAQITDGIAAGNEYAAELVSARTDEDGYVHTSLKERIDDGMHTLEDTMENKAPAIECDASGLVVTVDDAAAMPVHGLVSQIVPVQAGSGDPSPDNVRAISGWTKVNAVRAKKNLYGGLYLANDFASKINNSTINADAKTVSYTAQSISGKLLCNNFKPDTRYTAIITLTAETSGSTANMRFIYTDGTRSDAFRLTDTADGKKRAVAVSAAGKSVDRIVGAMFSGVQYLLYEESGIFEGVLTADDFEPFDGASISSDLPETVYGGKMDWQTGVLKVDRKKYVFDETMDFLCQIEGYALPRIRTRSSVGAKHATKDMISNQYANITTDAIDNSIRSINGALYVYDTRFTSEDVVKNLVTTTPIEIVYPLETTYEIQLTPQQMDMIKGYNNIWSDTGDTSIVYVADTGLVIEKLMNRIAALEAVVSAPTT